MTNELEKPPIDAPWAAHSMSRLPHAIPAVPLVVNTLFFQFDCSSELFNSIVRPIAGN